MIGGMKADPNLKQHAQNILDAYGPELAPIVAALYAEDMADNAVKAIKALDERIKRLESR